MFGQVFPHEKFPADITETFKVIGYIDDVKPVVTSLEEITLIDEGSSIFEAASGCKLHRNPLSRKIKLLPLGKWKNALRLADLPVNYIGISNHSDMMGVILKSSYTLSKQENGESLVERIANTIRP